MTTAIEPRGVREGDVLWTPSPERTAGASLTAFAARLAAERGIARETDAALWRWSVENPDAFWSAAWDLLGVIGDRGDGPALAERRMPGAVWFPGARLNYAEQALAPGADGDVALVALGEDRPPAFLTRGELRAAVGAAAAGLRTLGVLPGERVAALLPNGPEAIIGLLACAAIGAVWCSCSPDFGAAGAADRFGQVEPAVLLACDGYRYAGRGHDRREVVGELRRALPSVRHTVLVPCLDGAARLEGALTWDELLQAGDMEPSPERVAFDHPLWIVFSSGTTGPPKALVHGHGGIVLEHLKQLALHLDVHAGAASGSELLLFVVLGDGAVLDDEPRGRLRARVREDCSPRHVPDAIHALAALPRTRTGKLVEVPVKRVLEGAPVDQVVNRSALADPRALEPFVALGKERAA